MTAEAPQGTVPVGSGWKRVRECRTLIQVHEALVALRPALGAHSGRWLTYHLRSASAYEQIAEIDRGHHHEAMYWARHELQKAEAIKSPDIAGLVGGETGTS